MEKFFNTTLAKCIHCETKYNIPKPEEGIYFETLFFTCDPCTKKEKDNVNHPSHYTSSKSVCSKCNHTIECIDIVRHLDFNIGNAIKYLWRFKGKNGIEDLKKAIWYINDEIRKMESVGGKQ